MPRHPYATKKPLVIETFWNPTASLESTSRIHDAPFCINETVGIFKFKITVEQVDEPAEVLQERLRDLWRKCANHHHFTHMKQMGKALGIELAADELGKEKPAK